MLLFPPILPLAAYYFCKVPAKSRPRGKQSKKRFKAGADRVKSERFIIIDESRPTQAYKKFAGRPERELHGEIWRPAHKREAGPLVVYSHGFMSNRRESLYLVRYLASHGYTVVSMDFPLTGMKAPNGPLVQDIINQPVDVSLIIDYMLERNEDSDDVLFNTIDPSKIAITGVSLGALTAMLTTFHAELKDPRIAALISIAGPTTIFNSRFYADSEVPTLLIYGDSDSLVLYEEHAFHALTKLKRGSLLTVKRGSHAGFAQQASTFLRFLKNPDSIAFMALRFEKDEKPWDFVPVLGGEQMGIVKPEREEPPNGIIVPRAMKASRQHMYTSLATHMFIESVFSDDSEVRDSANHFLHKVLPEENLGEISMMKEITA